MFSTQLLTLNYLLKSALFGFQWTPMPLWLATRTSPEFCTCQGRGWTCSHNAVRISARFKQWNSITFSFISAGRCCAKVVFALKEMAWWHFQFVYQPRDAFNSGSELSSSAFRQSLKMCTDRPANIKANMQSASGQHNQHFNKNLH